MIGPRHAVVLWAMLSQLAAGHPNIGDTVCPAVDGATSPPVTVVLALDVTGSMTWGQLDAAADAFISHLRSDDRAMLVRIARNVTVHGAFTSDKDVLGNVVRSALQVPDALRRGPSPVWDGVNLAVERLEREPGRRAIVLLTDGRSTGNRVGLREVASRAARAGISIHIVGDRDHTSAWAKDADATLVHIDSHTSLAWLAEQTGGRLLTDPRLPRQWAIGMSPGKELLTLLTGLQCDGSGMTTATALDGSNRK